MAKKHSMIILTTIILGCNSDLQTDTPTSQDSTTSIRNETSNSDGETKPPPIVDGEIGRPAELEFEIPDDLPFPARFIVQSGYRLHNVAGVTYRITAQAPDVASSDEMIDFFKAELVKRNWTIVESQFPMRGMVYFKQGEKKTGSVLINTDSEHKGVMFSFNVEYPGDSPQKTQ